ncbi:MAG: type II toxin-antitoxin system VapC family toxin [Prosthecobacter sp.]|uniref:type II toxin-antitoxin system VapC family toxin n=1 Tax=Prosthecobacter sp. TaxID=1965333 RepID=UPI0038FFD615
MTVYADTSWWIACKITDDDNHDAAVRAFDLFPDLQVVWTPWQRVEVFNSLRQLERAAVVIPGKARELIRLLEQEVRLGYWPHAEFDWRDAVRTASELSAEHGLSVPIRGMDLFHVAIAIEVGADALLTFDADQKEFAIAAGVRVVALAARRSR